MIGRLRLQDLMESVRAEVPLGVYIEHEAGRGQERGRGSEEAQSLRINPLKNFIKLKCLTLEKCEPSNNVDIAQRVNVWRPM